MSLRPDEVKKIAHLARLAVDEAAVAGYARELSAILDLVERMNAVDTNGIEPLAHPLEMAQRLRPDQVTEPNQRDAFQAHAPLTEAGLYLVPKVIE